MAYGWPHGCYLNLFIVLTLEQEVGVLYAEPQQDNDMEDRRGCSVGELSILFQFILDDVNNRVNWHR